MALEESKRCFAAEIEQCKVDRQKYLLMIQDKDKKIDTLIK